MKYLKFYLLLTIAVITMAACNTKKSKQTTDNELKDTLSTATSDSDTTQVAEADSTHSFRNDRGTDSVSVGKSVPIKP